MCKILHPPPNINNSQVLNCSAFSSLRRVLKSYMNRKHVTTFEYMVCNGRYIFQIKALIYIYNKTANNQNITVYTDYYIKLIEQLTGYKYYVNTEIDMYNFLHICGNKTANNTK